VSFPQAVRARSAERERAVPVRGRGIARMQDSSVDQEIGEARLT
jgi:hypothetical protein